MSVRACVSTVMALAVFALPACKNIQEKERELTDQCKKESPCQKQGLCTGRCRPEPCVCMVGSNADCAQSAECPNLGRCTAKDGKCVVASNADCAHTAACKATGFCTAKDGVCVIGSDEDCRQSDLCRDARKCKLKGSACIDATFNPALLEPALASETAPEKFKVKLTTTKGDVVVEVTRAWAPLGAERFYNLAKIGYFNDVAFYKVDEASVEFGIHGKPEITTAWHEMKIKDDPPKQSNLKGTVAFTRPRPNSRWAQVIVHLKDNRDMDQVGYAPFGKVISGLNVLESLGKVSTDQLKVQVGGNSYLKASHPQLDYITSVSLL
jgi:peptidyl-prolyl cis-trans isomerase A (cyclophilin A)